jgi:hypothetical protein
MSEYKVNIVKGGNKGGRRTERKFGDEPNSILNTLRTMSPEIQALYRENRKRFAGDASSIEIWAASSFSSDGRATDYGEEA